MVPNEKNIAVVSIVCSSISLFSCLIIILLYQKFPTIHSANSSMIMKILYFDLGFSFIGLSIAILYLIDLNLDEASSSNVYWCNTQAFFTNYTIMGCQISTTLVCVSLYHDMIGSSIIVEPFWYKLTRYVLPFIFSLIPVLTDGFGPQPLMNLSNCFFIDNAMKVYCYYMMEYLSFFVNLIVISLVVVKIKKNININTRKLISLFLYPSILLICWIFPDILIQLDIYSGYTYQVIGLLIGTFDSCLYGFNILRHQLVFENGRFILKLRETITEISAISSTESLMQNENY